MNYETEAGIIRGFSGINQNLYELIKEPGGIYDLTANMIKLTEEIRGFKEAFIAFTEKPNVKDELFNDLRCKCYVKPTHPFENTTEELTNIEQAKNPSRLELKQLCDLCDNFAKEYNANEDAAMVIANAIKEKSSALRESTELENTLERALHRIQAAAMYYLEYQWTWLVGFLDDVKLIKDHMGSQPDEDGYINAGVLGDLLDRELHNALVDKQNDDQEDKKIDSTHRFPLDILDLQWLYVSCEALVDAYDAGYLTIAETFVDSIKKRANRLIEYTELDVFLEHFLKEILAASNDYIKGKGLARCSLYDLIENLRDYIKRINKKDDDPDDEKDPIQVWCEKILDILDKEDVFLRYQDFPESLIKEGYKLLHETLYRSQCGNIVLVMAAIAAEPKGVVPTQNIDRIRDYIEKIIYGVKEFDVDGF